MAELNSYMAWVLDALKKRGSKWDPWSAEGPRKVGHCNRCKGQCAGVTADCEFRVWDESTNPLKDIHNRS